MTWPGGKTGWQCTGDHRPAYDNLRNPVCPTRYGCETLTLNSTTLAALKYLGSMLTEPVGIIAGDSIY